MVKQFRGRNSAVLAAAVSTILSSASTAGAQETAKTFDEVIVTATRRSESVQDVPLNIAAVGDEIIEERGITNLADLSRSVPGLFVIDQGPRAANAIVVRGLNADPIGGTEALGNAGGGTVATYVGEIPLYVDLKLEDVERVEVLLGPQGTLYGAGTLGGAIRYIPKRPQFGAMTLDLRAKAYTLSQSDGIGSDSGMTFNAPLGDRLAFRASVDYLDDPGFIDYSFVVRNPGVSDPQPDRSNPAAMDANLRKEEDADFQKTLSGRAALRWQVTEAIDANLTYYYQNQEVGGRTLNHVAAFNTGRYESAQRYVEPNERTNNLTALEVTADLGFAELTSATGYSHYEDFGQRDQTDLLIGLQYGYEASPAFSAYTREDETDKTINQEFRLVSKTDGPLGWIGGIFYNRYKNDNVTKEYTPEYSQYLLNAGAPGVFRADALEYIATERVRLTEMAAYGELSFDFTEQLQVTIGGRWYQYELDTQTADDFPLTLTTSFPGGPAAPIDRGPNDIVLENEFGGQSDNGVLFKFNVSYDFTDDIMAYLTVSEGYRIGNTNGVPLCDGGATGQTTCTTPREFEYEPDSTVNYEIGARTEWFDRRLTLNASVFYIDWKKPQLSTATQTGAAPIIINGEGAESKGFDLSFNVNITTAFSISGSYGYAKAKLTDAAPDLIRTILPPGFDVDFEDGQAGDRLPGSPEQQGSLFANYDFPVFDAATLKFSYGVTAIGDIITRTGERGGGETLGGFALHSLSIAFDTSKWSAGLYAKNLFDKYAETGVRGTPLYLQTVADENGDPVTVRSYSRDVVRPREIGLRFNYKFEF